MFCSFALLLWYGLLIVWLLRAQEGHDFVKYPFSQGLFKHAKPEARTVSYNRHNKSLEWWPPEAVGKARATKVRQIDLQHHSG